MSYDAHFLRLKYFLALAEAGSLSKAATALEIGKPAVSRRIRELEERLGTTLFVRTPRGVFLTEAGAQFRDRCERVFEEAEIAAQDITSGTARGTVSLGLPPITAKLIAVPLLETVTRDYPGLRLDLLEGYSFTVREWLDEGRIDIGLFYDGPGTDRRFAKPVMVETLQVVAAPHMIGSPSSRCTPQEALRLPLIVPSRRHGNRMQIEWMAEKFGIDLNVSMEVDSLTSMIRLLVAGFGYSLLPAFAVADDLREGTLGTMVVEPALTRSLLMGTSAKRKTSLNGEVLMPVLEGLIAGAADDS